jgi:hypothetical protein
MVRRMGFACIGVVLIAVAGCGEPSTVEQRGAAPATVAGSAPESAPESTEPATDVVDNAAVTARPTVVEPVPEIVPTTAELPGSTSVTNSSVVDPGLVAIDTVAPFAGVLGGVTIDDPLPPQADASDPVIAEAAVRYAYQHWILVDLDKDLRGLLVENGEDNVDNLDTRLKAIRGTIDRGRFAVDSVEFTDTDHANVAFRIQWNDGPSPIFPDPLNGTAVFQNGTWRITRTSLCLLAFSMGEGCAGNDTDNPVPPTAMQALVVPPGYVWQAHPTVALLPVPGGLYLSGPNGDTLSIATEVLAGVSELGPDEADKVLSSSRFGTEDGTALQVDGRPGRVSAVNGENRLVYIRADDVIVSIFATTLAGNQLVAVAMGLQPVPG